MLDFDTVIDRTATNAVKQQIHDSFRSVHRTLYQGRPPGRIDELKLYGGASAVKDKN